MQFKTWQIEIVGDDRIADEIIKILRIVTRPIFYGFPDDQTPQYDVPLERCVLSFCLFYRLLPMEPLEPGYGQGIVEVYKAYCNFYNTPISDTFIQFIQGLCVGNEYSYSMT